jgi:hypothetical protein
VGASLEATRMPEEVLVEDFPAGDKGSRIVELEVSADEEASSPDVDVAMTGAPVSRVQQKCGKLKCAVLAHNFCLAGRGRSPKRDDRFGGHTQDSDQSHRTAFAARVPVKEDADDVMSRPIIGEYLGKSHKNVLIASIWLQEEKDFQSCLNGNRRKWVGLLFGIFRSL